MVRELDSLDGVEIGYVLNYYGRTVGNHIHPHDCLHIRLNESVPPKCRKCGPTVFKSLRNRYMLKAQTLTLRHLDAGTFDGFNQ